MYLLWPFIIHSQSSQEADVYITCNLIWRCTQGWSNLDGDSQSQIWLTVILNHLFYFKTCLHCIEHNTDVTRKPIALSQQVIGPVYDLGLTIIFHSKKKKKKRIRKRKLTLFPTPVQKSEWWNGRVFKRFIKHFQSPFSPSADDQLLNLGYWTSWTWVTQGHTVSNYIHPLLQKVGEQARLSDW